MAIDLKNGSKKFYFSNIHSGLSGFNRINKNSLDSINNLKKLKKIDTSSKVKTINAKSYINKSKVKFYDLFKKNNSFGTIEKILDKYNFKIYDIIFISKNPKKYRTDWVDVLYKRYQLKN